MVRRKILAIDDEPLMLDLIVSLLSDDFDLAVANGGERGLALAATEPKPDLVLLDIVMPGMDGYQVCEALKTNRATRDIPVIFLTVRSDVADETRGFSLGAVDYISKPISPPILLARVATHLNLSDSRRRLERHNEELERLVARRTDHLSLEIAERLKAEDTLRMTVERLTRANAEMERFAYIASHDLNEPLNLVAGYAELLRQTAGSRLEGEAGEYLGEMLSGVERMKALVKGILALSRIGSADLDIRPHDLCDLAREAMGVLGLGAEGPAVRLTLDPLPRLPVDGPQIVHLFQNLIANALKFSDVPADIHVFAQRKSQGWKICVHDRGRGVARDERKTIFQAFRRGSDQSQADGLGLGLSICKRIVDRHDGTIGLDSEPGKGSTFWFLLPGEG